MILVSQVERRQDEKWREVNMVGLAGPLVSFGDLTLSTITARHYPGIRSWGTENQAFPSSLSSPLPHCRCAALFLFIPVFFRTHLVSASGIEDLFMSAPWSQNFYRWCELMCSGAPLWQAPDNFGVCVYEALCLANTVMRRIIQPKKRIPQCCGKGSVFLLWSRFWYYSSCNVFLWLERGASEYGHIGLWPRGFKCSVNIEGKMVYTTHVENPRNTRVRMKTVCAGKLLKPVVAASPHRIQRPGGREALARRGMGNAAVFPALLCNCFQFSPSLVLFIFTKSEQKHRREIDTYNHIVCEL